MAYPTAVSTIRWNRWLERLLMEKIMELLDKEESIRQQIFDYFGYIEGWCVLPFNNAIEYYWHLTNEGRGGKVKFAKHEKNLFEGTIEDGYSNEIYTQRHLPKWIYRAADYTMIVVDTHIDGNKFLQIFDNAKERP